MPEQYSAEGVNGLVEVEDDTVRIWIKGALSLVNPDLMRVKEIYLGDIASIHAPAGRSPGPGRARPDPVGPLRTA